MLYVMIAMEIVDTIYKVCYIANTIMNAYQAIINK